MSLVFVIFLTIVLICAYICKHSPDEIAELAASILLLSLIVSLVLTPWLLQFLLLILVVVSNKRQLLPSEHRTEPQTEKKSQLMYRGVQSSTNLLVPRLKALTVRVQENIGVKFGEFALRGCLL